MPAFLPCQLRRARRSGPTLQSIRLGPNSLDRPSSGPAAMARPSSRDRIACANHSFASATFSTGSLGGGVGGTSRGSRADRTLESTRPAHLAACKVMRRVGRACRSLVTGAAVIPTSSPLPHRRDPQRVLSLPATAVTSPKARIKSREQARRTFQEDLDDTP
jgi:hypothetical protein